MAGSINTRLRQVKKAVEKQFPPDKPVVIVNWTQEGEPEPEPENVQVSFRVNGVLETCSLAQFREKFPEGVEVHIVYVDWNTML
jgi:hypothetical protein